MRVLANGTTLHVAEREAGDGPALLFLHYFAGSARAWNGVVDRLGREYRCVAPDLRGFGRSAAPAHGYAVDDGADDVAALVERLALGEYVLVGHSMGGKIALALAARRPPGLCSLVLVAPSPPTPEPMGDADRAHLLATHGDHAAAAETARKIVARPLARAALHRTIDDNVRTSRPAWRGWLEGGSRENIAARVCGIAVPTLVAVGAADPVIPPELLEREVVRHIPGARMTILPDVGHLVPLETPAALAALIAAELRAVRLATTQSATPRPAGVP